MNLLYETIEILKQHGKNPADVEWVGDNEKYCDWDTFAKQFGKYDKRKQII